MAAESSTRVDVRKPRRSFSVEEKRRIVSEYWACPQVVDTGFSRDLRDFFHSSCGHN